MSQLQSLEAIEKRLWSAADLLRANSGLASNEYFMPVMGLIFLRHAYSRFLIHLELKGLNEEAAVLAAKIARNIGRWAHERKDGSARPGRTPAL